MSRRRTAHVAFFIPARITNWLLFSSMTSPSPVQMRTLRSFQLVSANCFLLIVNLLAEYLQVTGVYGKTMNTATLPLHCLECLVRPIPWDGQNGWPSMIWPAQIRNLLRS